MHEYKRLAENYAGTKNWLKWGPYLSERQWGTVREDYSHDGNAWDYFPHDHARSRVYRWGEDGIAGMSDDLQRLCFSVALWNGKDPILKERLFGLTGTEGNHGEDCKELYYYLDNTPTHSYMKHLYKYPITEFPYQRLVETNAARGKNEPEYELIDTGAFESNNYFDVFTEFAKGDEEDILIRITAFNRSEQDAILTVLPQIWFRNLWSFGLMGEKPNICKGEKKNDYAVAFLQHPELGEYFYYYQIPEQSLFTENETNKERIWGTDGDSLYVKDAFHTAVINDNFKDYADKNNGTKFSPVYQITVQAKSSFEIRVRLTKERFNQNPLLASFEEVFRTRMHEANEFYEEIIDKNLSADLVNIQRQAFAGMLWSKQYYNIDVRLWLNGDLGQPTPPETRKEGRNKNWHTLNNEDIISMPDKWEYPWYAAWDLAFHCIPLAVLDVQFAKNQLLLFLREWYMHPNGQIPAYEWAFSDVNPPVHAMACLKVYGIEKAKTGKGDIDFLKKAFQKLCINFTWWVNRKDSNGKNVFEGGFLGLDNIGVFDRNIPIPGGHLEQADGTSWMAMYCLNMLEMALEINRFDRSYEPMTTKFFEHFALIAETINRTAENWTGAWDESEGFYYDILVLPGHEYVPLKVRSMVGLTAIFATFCVDRKSVEESPEFFYRMNWFNDYLRKNKEYSIVEEQNEEKVLLSILPMTKLKRLLGAILSEQEFLSDFGIRSVSKIHSEGVSVDIKGMHFGLKYEPAESSSDLFGGNSNWRGPIWFPMNYMIIDSLKKFHQYYGSDLKVECPTGSGHLMDLSEVANEISRRLSKLFTKDKEGNRPVYGLSPQLYKDEHFENLILFYEYFHGDSGRGVGASHQTGWTGIITEISSKLINWK